MWISWCAFAACDVRTGDARCGSVRAVDPQWLTDAEQVAWRRFITVVGLLPSALDSSMRDHHGINMHEYWVLAMLSETPEQSLRMQELARRSTASASRLSHTINRLEQRGLVLRQQSACDRRGQSATLTDAGLELVKIAAPSHVADVRRRLFDALSADDVRQLSRICDEVLKNLDPTGDRSPAVQP